MLYLRHKNMKHTKLTYINHQRNTHTPAHTHQIGLASMTHPPQGTCLDVSTLFKASVQISHGCVRICVCERERELRRSWGLVHGGGNSTTPPPTQLPYPIITVPKCPRGDLKKSSAIPSSLAFFLSIRFSPTPTHGPQITPCNLWFPTLFSFAPFLHLHLFTFLYNSVVIR